MVLDWFGVVSGCLGWYCGGLGCSGVVLFWVGLYSKWVVWDSKWVVWGVSTDPMHCT